MQKASDQTHLSLIFWLSFSIFINLVFLPLETSAVFILEDQSSATKLSMQRASDQTLLSWVFWSFGQPDKTDRCSFLLQPSPFLHPPRHLDKEKRLRSKKHLDKETKIKKKTKKNILTKRQRQRQATLTNDCHSFLPWASSASTLFELKRCKQIYL